jgi:uncharacterized membrane protein YphA (DoxX/SURF4 family)
MVSISYLTSNGILNTNNNTVIGIFLFGGGLVVFLLPFNLAAHAPNGWSTDYIIAMIVVGFCTLIFFGVWEYWLAPSSPPA